MDARTREALEEIAKTLEEWRLDEATMALWVVHGPRMMGVHMREAAKRIRAAIPPAEAPLRGEVQDITGDIFKPPAGEDDGRRMVDFHTFVVCPTREDAERVAAALRAVLARLEKA